MGSANRRVGFLASVASASLFYVVCFTVSLGFDGPRDMHNGLFDIGFAIFFWFFDGVAAALALMVLPWYLVVRLSARLQCFSLLYFSTSGAVITLVIGCGTSSLSPKPLFIEDQSFIEGFMITAERQAYSCRTRCQVVLCKRWILVIHRLHSATATDDKKRNERTRGQGLVATPRWLEGLLTRPPSCGYPPKFPKRPFSNAFVCISLNVSRRAVALSRTWGLALLRSGFGVWGAVERKRHLSRDRRFGCRQPINRHPMHAECLGDFAGGLAFSQQA
jgi:hypothetical protein